MPPGMYKRKDFLTFCLAIVQNPSHQLVLFCYTQCKHQIKYPWQIQITISRSIAVMIVVLSHLNTECISHKHTANPSASLYLSMSFFIHFVMMLTIVAHNQLSTIQTTMQLLIFQRSAVIEKLLLIILQRSAAIEKQGVGRFQQSAERWFPDPTLLQK